MLDHAEKLHEVPDEYLADAMLIAKKIAIAQDVENYNILQNNGRIAHQVGIIPSNIERF
jgi:diadenosine tetraphosphate (Ap4A) HIT family hydrolase